MRLYALTHSRKGEQPLFVSDCEKQICANSLVQVFVRNYNQAGLRNAPSHSGSRAFLNGLAHKGVNVRVLAALVRHQNTPTTQRYTELGEHQIRAAVEFA